MSTSHPQTFLRWIRWIFFDGINKKTLAYHWLTIIQYANTRLYFILTVQHWAGTLWDSTKLWCSTSLIKSETRLQKQLLITHGGLNKRTIFCRRNFQTHFLEGELFYFSSNFVCFWGPIDKYASINANNGSGPIPVRFWHISIWMFREVIHIKERQPTIHLVKRFGVKGITSFWNLAGSSAVTLSRRLPNFRATVQLYTYISWLRDFMRSYVVKTRDLRPNMKLYKCVPKC